MRILLVEDDENLAKALTAVLSKHNYILDVSTDGEMGWEMINIISYDLVLLDVMLPKLNGIITLLRRARKLIFVCKTVTLAHNFFSCPFFRNLISNLPIVVLVQSIFTQKLFVSIALGALVAP